MAEDRKPLLGGESRPMVRVEDFCHSTGLDVDTVAGVVRDLRLGSGWSTDGRLRTLFEDELPTADQLRSLGLTVRADYDPARLEDAPHEGPPSWTMIWDDEPSPSSSGSRPAWASSSLTTAKAIPEP